MTTHTKRKAKPMEQESASRTPENTQSSSALAMDSPSPGNNTPPTPPASEDQFLLPPAAELMNTQEADFTLVVKKKQHKKTAPPTDTTAPHSNTQSRHLPRSRMGVTLALRPPSAPRLAFKVMASPEITNPYEVVKLLQKDATLCFTARPGRNNSFIIYPENESTALTLRSTKTLHGKEVNLNILDPNTTVTKGVLMGFLQSFPVDLIRQLNNIISAIRCTFNGHSTRQVVAEHEGPLPGNLDIGVWGTFYLHPYTPEPLRCYKWQAFGHTRAQCRNLPRCGICSAPHDTDQCLQRYKAKEVVPHKCPNCNETHHAWNKSCPERRHRVQQGIQIQKHLLEIHSNAPSGTFVWGTQENRKLEQNQQHPPLAAEFPPLPSQATPPTPQQDNIAISAPAPQEPTVTLTQSSLKSLLSDFALTLSQILKQDLDQEKLATAVDCVVNNHILTPSTPKATQIPVSQATAAHQVRPLPPTSDKTPQPPSNTSKTAASSSTSYNASPTTTSATRPHP